MAKRRGQRPNARKLPETSVSEVKQEREDVIERDGDVFVRMPDGTPPEVVEQVVQFAYSGPLPPPEMIRKYEDAHPGFASRILEMAEKEQAKRHRNDSHILKNDTFKIAGSICVSLALVAGAVFCGSIGQPEFGGVLGGAGVLSGIITAFLRGTDK